MSNLDTNALRRIVGSPRESTPAAPDELLISRRDVLKLGGVATIAATSLLSPRSFASEFTIQGDERRFAFLVDGVERWVIEAARFGERARLRLNNTDHEIRLILSNARYPGTDVAADLRSVIRRTARGWRMRLRLAFADTRADVRFVDWLVGEHSGRMRVSPGQIASLGGSGSIDVVRTSLASFAPSWQIDFEDGATVISTIEQRWTGAAHLRLASNDDGVLRTSEPRSVFALSRTSDVWKFPLDRLAAGHPFRFVPVGSPFDLVHVEVAADGAALYARANDRRASYAFYPGGRLRTASGEPFAMSLQSVVYARSFGGDEREAVLARFPSDPVTAHGAGFAVALQDPTHEHPPVEAHAENGNLCSFQCTPDASAAFIELPGAVIATSEIDDCDTRIDIGWASLGCAISDIRRAIHVDHPKHDLTCALPLRTTVLRPEDMLYLHFRFKNATVKVADGRAKVTPNSDSAFMIVEFPPQNIAEEAYFKQTDVKNNDPNEAVAVGEPPSEALKPPPIPSRMAESSRLAFRFTKPIDYTLDSLLDWRNLEPSLVEVAQAAGTTKDTAIDLHTKTPLSHDPTIAEPADYQTSIEAPYRLMLSPGLAGDWRHTIAPRKQKGETELWHTRLESRGRDDGVPNTTELERNVRAVWSPDFFPGTKSYPHFSRGCDGRDPNLPFRTTLDRRDRGEIVHLSSDYDFNDIESGNPYPPGVIGVNQLMLSSLGAWIDLEGRWDPLRIVKGRDFCTKVDRTKDPCTPIETWTPTVESWKHKATMGRDHFVRVVYAGFLFPFGHFAVLIKETERDIEGQPLPIAYLRQRMYIVVPKPLRVYPREEMPDDGRRFPFRRVRMDTAITPDLFDPSDEQIPGFPAGQDIFWPKVSRDEPFEFAVTAWDVNEPERETHFVTPLIWMDITFAYDHASLLALVDVYKTSGDRRKPPTHGQKIAYAEPKKEGDTTLPTDFITLSADVLPLDNDLCRALRIARRPGFQPSIEGADVHISAVERLTQDPTATKIVWNANYVNHGFANTQRATSPANTRSPADNHGEVFADLHTSAEMTFPGDKSAGLATPDLNIRALSRLAGPIAGNIDDFCRGDFNPVLFFDKLATTKLLGVINLGDVIQPIKDIRNQLLKVPRLIMEEVRQIDTAVKEKVAAILNAIRTNVVDPVEDILDAADRFTGEMCEDTREQLHFLIIALQDELDVMFGVVFDLEEERLRFAIPSRCLRDGEPAFMIANRLTPRPMISQFDDLVLIDGPFVTFEAIAAIYSRLENALVASGDATQTDLQKLQKAFDIRAAARKALSEFQTEVQAAASTIASIGDLPLLDAFRRLVSVLESLEHSDVASMIAQSDELVRALKEFAAEAQVIARAIANPADFALVLEMTQKFASARGRLHDAARKLESDLKDAVDTTRSRVTSTISGLHTTAVASLTAIHQAASSDYGAVTSALTDHFFDLVEPSLRDGLSVAAVVQTKIGDIQTLAADMIAQLTLIRKVFEDTVRGFIDLIMQPREINVEFNLNPELRSVPQGAPVFEAGGDTKLNVNAKLTAIIRPADPLHPSTSFSVRAHVNDFKIHLFPFAKFLSLEFNFVSIESDGKGTPNVNPDIRKVKFGEALTFVQRLQDALPFNKPGNGFFVNVDTKAIRVGYRMAIPTIPIGALTLRAVSLGAALELPFRSAPARVRFSFADRDRPFNLSVGILGGGGFFAVSLGPDKVERLEAALEFGASAELSVGPANGEAHIMAGIYYDCDSGGAKLSGYLRAGGSFDVAGLISMSLEFYLSFTYIPSTNSAAGDAIVNVSIHMGLFTVEFTLHCHREFAGEKSSEQSARIEGPTQFLFASRPPRLVGRVAGPAAFVFPMAGTTAVCANHCGGVDPQPLKRDEFFEKEVDWCAYRSYFAGLPEVSCHG